MTVKSFYTRGCCLTLTNILFWTNFALNWINNISIWTFNFWFYGILFFRKACNIFSVIFWLWQQRLHPTSFLLHLKNPFLFLIPYLCVGPCWCKAHSPLQGGSPSQRQCRPSGSLNRRHCLPSGRSKVGPSCTGRS